MATSLTQESIIKKFHNSDVSDVYRLARRSDQILWVLNKIQKDFNIDNYISDSVLVDILVEVLGISCTVKSINNSLNPIRKKIHKKIHESEIYYKIMYEGVQHVEKLLSKSKKPVYQVLDSKTFLDKQSIKNTVDIVKKMGKTQNLSAGLYYIVLIDLVGSSTASSKVSPDDNKKRIKEFIKFTKQALPKTSNNYLIFIKSIGDASLFLFTNFEDILNWATSLDSLCDDYNKKCISKQKPDVFQMYSKKCVHLGEVFFDEDSDPIALAVNQIAKIEKEFKQDQLGITDVVKQVILPRINSAQLTATKLRNIILPGETISKPLWVVGYQS